MRATHVLASAVALAVVGTATADFSGAFDPANWTFFDQAGGTGTLDPTTMFLVSGDMSLSGYTQYTIIAPSDLTINFDWDYFSIDSPGYDEGGYVINGVYTMLADASPASGSGSFNVLAGDEFGFYAYTADGVFGPGEFTVTNFEAIPAPGALALLGVAGLAARRRRR